MTGDDTLPTRFTLNGAPCSLEVEASTSLLAALRDRLGLTGTKHGCGIGACGVCNVFVDGALVRSCLKLAADTEGCAVMTIEGASDDALASCVQQAFVDAGAIQCGYCMPGMILAAAGLIARDPAPSVKSIREGLAGTLCRCSGYVKVIEAVSLAAGRWSETPRQEARP